MAASTSGAHSLQIHEMQRREDAIPEIQKEDRINCLPNELLLLIFSHLSVTDLLGASLVCRDWQELVFNLPPKPMEVYLRVLYPELKDWQELVFNLPSISIPMEVYLRVIHPELKIRYIGESFWKKYEPYFHLTAKDPPFSDREIIVEKAKKMLEEVSVEDDAGITLLLEPEGFSFRLLRKGCKTLNDGGKDLFRYVSRDVVNLVGNDPEKETQLLGLTTGIVRGTRSKTVTRQQEYLQNIGCELAGVRTLSLLAVATFLESREKEKPIRLLGGPDGCCTYSRSIQSYENAFGVWSVCVGGFIPAGLGVGEIEGRARYLGAVGLRKF